MNALTFDIDWAPDSVINQVRQQLSTRGHRATFLVTHDSDILTDLRSDGHELGIHPNFAPGSTQGKSTLDIIENLLHIVPDARVMRTHGLVQSSRLFIEIATAFPQLELDLSLFTYRSQYCEMTSFYFSPDHAPLQRLNYNWEDDIAFVDPLFDPSKFMPWGLDHLFDFHPLHIVLNSSDGSEYQQLKKHLGEWSLIRAKQDEIDRCVNRGQGIGSYFDLLLASGMKFQSLLPNRILEVAP